MSLGSSTFIVSLDLELHWGIHDRLGVDDYRENLEGVRRAVHGMLRLFQRYQVHATWATVGFLFAEGRDNCLRFAPQRQPSYRDPKLDPYPLLEKTGRSEKEAPFHYAPSLIREIGSVAGQEIATHTFSHYCCLEEGQNCDEFREDLLAAKRIARRLEIEFESIVFPRNQIRADYLRVCREIGLRFFRGNPNWLFRRVRNKQCARGLRLLDAYLPLTPVESIVYQPEILHDMVNVQASRFLRPLLGPSAIEAFHTRRVLSEMLAAAHKGACYHLWWHPHNFGRQTKLNLQMLETILQQLSSLRDRHGMQSKNMREVGREVIAKHMARNEPAPYPMREKPLLGQTQAAGLRSLSLN